tara:strand:- start:267 stop:869 length:603 start_codon:yes stop_codon:yes gene_type:complete
MYFATGDGGNAIGESYTAPSDKLYSIHPISATTLDLVFDSGHGYFDSVRLTITSGKHKTVISTINNAINQSHKSLIAVCDSDNSSFIDSNITDCVISLGVTASVTKISGSTQVKVIDINTKSRPIKSMSLANIHASDSVSVAVFLANPTDNYYIIKNVVIPFATTLVLDEDEVDYDTSAYNLYVKLSAGDSAVDVIIKNN